MKICTLDTFINPAESGLYYLGSRYYDAEVGRFINADNTENLGANGKLNNYNLYAYCINNPVNGVDANGEFAVPAIIASAIGGGVAGAVISAISYLADRGYDSGFWKTVGVGAFNGAIGGATGMLGNKGIKIGLSLVVGIIAGVYAASANGETFWENVITGVSTGLTAALGTSASAFIFDTQGLTVLTTGFANYVTTIVTSVPAEIANKAIDYGVNKTLIQNKSGVKKTTKNSSNKKAVLPEWKIKSLYDPYFMT